MAQRALIISEAAEPTSGYHVIRRNGGIVMQTSSVANGQVAQANRTIVNWDVAAADWAKLKTRAHDDWVKVSSK